MPIDYFKEKNIRFKIVKLSYQKISLEYEAPVYSINPLNCIDHFKIKLIYRTDLYNNSNQSESPIWKLVNPKDFYKNKIYRKWKIKKSFITTNLSASLIQADGYVLSGLITSFVFSDRSWSRDHLIDNLLKK